MFDNILIPEENDCGMETFIPAKGDGEQSVGRKIALVFRGKYTIFCHPRQ